MDDLIQELKKKLRASAALLLLSQLTFAWEGVIYYAPPLTYISGLALRENEIAYYTLYQDDVAWTFINSVIGVRQAVINFSEGRHKYNLTVTMKSGRESGPSLPRYIGGQTAKRSGCSV